MHGAVVCALGGSLGVLVAVQPPGARDVALGAVPLAAPTQHRSCCWLCPATEGSQRSCFGLRTDKIRGSKATLRWAQDWGQLGHHPARCQPGTEPSRRVPGQAVAVALAASWDLQPNGPGRGRQPQPR